MQKTNILKILGENDQNINFRKIWGGSSGLYMWLAVLVCGQMCGCISECGIVWLPFDVSVWFLVAVVV